MCFGENGSQFENIEGMDPLFQINKISFLFLSHCITELRFLFVSGISPHEDLPVDFNITGDPTQDPYIDLHLLTVDRIYKMQLQRLEHNILHEDVRLLTVSIDSSGRTVFKEQLKPVCLSNYQ